jgi:hypothetical protein
VAAVDFKAGTAPVEIKAVEALERRRIPLVFMGTM